MSLAGELQITRTSQVNATAETVWGVLADARLLPHWVPAVDSVQACNSDGERVGSRRTCAANLNGKPGTMVEECVELVPLERIAYSVVDESFGMNRMFADYGFSITLDASDEAVTGVTLRTHYTPRNVVFSLMSRLVMRRQLGQVCDAIVGGLKTFAESRA